MENIIINIPFILCAIFGLIGLYKFNNNGRLFLIISLGILLCYSLSEVIKTLLSKFKIFLRPNNCGKCHKLDMNNCHLETGMPSGHAMSLAFFFMIILIHFDFKFNIYTLLSFVLFLIVICQRYISHCHSPTQLLIGSILGGLIAFFMNYIFKEKCN